MQFCNSEVFSCDFIIYHEIDVTNILQLRIDITNYCGAFLIIQYTYSTIFNFVLCKSFHVQDLIDDFF